MPFLKIIPPGGWSFNEPTSQLVKVSSRGLRGNDLQSFIKRAGNALADKIRHLDLRPGDVAAHDIIVGATEFFGPNRNGDGFKVAACIAYHPTFVKHGRCYRNHDNKNPDRSYGFIKFSDFNECMKRIELISIYNGTKEAADRNGGLLADEEVELLNRGESFPTSMACKVAYDVCSACGNRAKNRSEYCRGIDEGGSCPGGGLMNKIAVVTGNDKNPINHADNPHPLFFDKSKVARGADRIAFAMGLTKSADGRVLGGAALAEKLGLSAPDDLLLDGVEAELYTLAWKMAELEEKVAESGRERLAFASSVQPKVDWVSSGNKLGDTLQALAEEKIAMPVEGFLSLIRQSDEGVARIADQVREHLPGIYGRLVKSGEFSRLIEGSPFLPATRALPRSVKTWAAKLAKDYALTRQTVEKRAMLAAIRDNGVLPDITRPSMVKTAGACSPAVEEVAKHYAIYKLAAAYLMLKNVKESPEILKLLVVQNAVCPSST
jgi:hypothetical protein